MVFLTITLFCYFVCVSHGSVRHSDGRIFGGEPADIKDIPYQLSIRIANDVHDCGASIVSPEWAICAAHCFDQINGTDFTIKAGTSSRTRGGIKYEVAKLIVHPQYDNNTSDYDIALIQVKRQFDLDLEEIKIIPIAEAPPKEGNLAQTSGWGITEDGNSSDQLLKVEVPIVNHAICKEAYATAPSLPHKITDRMICAGYFETGGKDSCGGDSGGPLVVNNKLVGIVSWGLECGLKGFPGVYTNINSLRAWIKEHSGV